LVIMNTKKTYNTLITNTKKSTFAFFLLFILSATAYGQFTASVNRNKVGLQENFQITFTTQGDISDFTPPSFSDFRMLSGPNSQTSFQSINGRTTRSQSYSYILRGKTAGKFTIGAAKVVLNGRKTESNPVAIEILKQAPKAGAEGNSISDNLFVKLSLDKSKVYVGEQVTATYTIYTAVNIVGYELDGSPSYQGFWVEELNDKKGIETRDEIIDGRKFRAAKIYQVALFPQRAGILDISQIDLKLTIREQRRRNPNSIFEDMFGGYSDKQHFVASNKRKLTVEALPNKGRPASYSGLVGRYNLKSSIDKTTAQTNDGITLKMEISGTGNINILTPQKLSLPNDIEVYEPKVKQRGGKNGTTIKGSKAFDYLLIPRRGGTFPIPQQSISYFDPSKEKYVTLTTPEYELVIEGGTNPQSTTVTGLDKEEIALLGEDIRYIKTNVGELNEKGKSFLGSTPFYLGLGAPVLLFLGILGYRRRQEGMTEDAKRSQSAGKVGLKRLKSARNKLNSQDIPGFYQDLGLALEGYLVDRYKMDKSSFTHENAIEKLHEMQIPMEQIQDLKTILDACDMARYAPGSVSSGSENHYSKALTLIDNLEKHA
jgi:hypothetical protein